MLFLAAYLPNLAIFLLSMRRREHAGTRPLALRTMFLCMAGASLGIGIRSAFTLDALCAGGGIAAGIGALVTLILWVARVLVPLSRRLPATDPAGRLGEILKRTSRNPWRTCLSGAKWGAILGIAVIIGRAALGSPHVFDPPTTAAHGSSAAPSPERCSPPWHGRTCSANTCGLAPYRRCGTFNGVDRDIAPAG